jgi:hypothetical protein
VVEGDGLLNRCTVKSRTEGSNPSLSANSLSSGNFPIVAPTTDSIEDFSVGTPKSITRTYNR